MGKVSITLLPSTANWTRRHCIVHQSHTPIFHPILNAARHDRVTRITQREARIAACFRAYRILDHVINFGRALPGELAVRPVQLIAPSRQKAVKIEESVSIVSS
jgi:hypothetical protein